MNKKNALALIITLLSITPYAQAITIYVNNQYGAPVALKINQGKKMEHEVTVPRNGYMPIGTLTLPFTGKFPQNEVFSIQIRTTGIGSSYVSPYTDISSFIEKIVYYNSLKPRKEDAVLTIQPSRFYSGWDIQLSWASGAVIGTFSMNDF